jgi:hypothetical protein
MIQIETNENNLYMVATGKLTDKDYDQMIPLLRDKIEKFDKINWYFQMKDFKGWSLSAFWRDVKFDVKNKDRFKKIAMVGESTWQKVMTELMKPFTKAEIKYFNEMQAVVAKNWIQQN